VPSRSQIRLAGTRKVLPSTRKTSKGSNPSSGGNLLISLSRKSSSSSFHCGTSLFPLKSSARLWKPSSSLRRLPRRRRWRRPLRASPSFARTNEDSASLARAADERELYDRLSVCKLGKSLAIRGRRASLARGVEKSSEPSPCETGTTLARLHPSRFNSSNRGKATPSPSGRLKEGSLRRLVRIRTFNVCAND